MGATMAAEPAEAARAQLEAVLEACAPLAVAVSGGVDSLTLAWVAHRRLGARAEMFHAVSPAVPPEATARTEALARAEGWRLHVLDAGEFADPAYRNNPVDRCFFCKRNLYGAIAKLTSWQIVSGTNRDDLGEYRPGLDAAAAAGVRHPYVEAGIDKPTLRAIAAAAGLGAIAALPAAPCLASRIETGLRVEPERLRAIHAAERLLDTALAPGAVRCRLRAGAVVIELDEAALAGLDAAAREAWQARLGTLLAEAGMALPVRFAPYRAGSAFLRPA